MGKSIRSKRNKRLRTLKREIVEPHYDVKHDAKMAVQEAAMAAPRVEIPKKRQDESVAPIHSICGGVPPAEGMAIDGGIRKSNGSDSKLQATRVIRKRGKSVRRDLSRKRKKGVKF